jgi:hypothetical protein
MCFLLGYTVDPVNPGFKVGRSAFEQVLVGIGADIQAIPENITSDTRTLTTYGWKRSPYTTYLFLEILRPRESYWVCWFGLRQPTLRNFSHIVNVSSRLTETVQCERETSGEG